MLASQFHKTPEFYEFVNYWAQHPAHPLEDWQYEVANDDTRLGYWDWVLCQIHQAGDDDE